MGRRLMGKRRVGRGDRKLLIWSKASTASITTCKQARGSSKACMTEDYVEMHARSAFSFLEGASLPEELVSACSELSIPAMALARPERRLWRATISYGSKEERDQSPHWF